MNYSTLGNIIILMETIKEFYQAPIRRSSLPPSPPAEKAAARKDQARKASTGDGAGDDSRCAIVMVRAVRGVKHEAAVGVLLHIVSKAYGCSKRADICIQTVAIE